MRSNRWILVVCALASALAAGGCSRENANAIAATAQTEPEVPQIRDLQASVEAYEKIYKRKPANLEQMVREGFIPALPPAPSSKRFTLDPATARVTVVPK